MASPTQWTWVWANSRCWWWTGRPGVCCSPWGCKESDTIEWLNWSETIKNNIEVHSYRKLSCFPVMQYYMTIKHDNYLYWLREIFHILMLEGKFCCKTVHSHTQNQIDRSKERQRNKGKNEYMKRCDDFSLNVQSKVKMKVTQLCLTLWSPMDYTVHGILQARRGSSQPRDWIQVSLIAGGFFTSWATREAQEYWSG